MSQHKKKSDGKVSLNITVAIRLRPFSTKEKREKIKRIVEMRENTVFLQKQDDTTQSFTFNRAYWSHDGYKENKAGCLMKDSTSSRYIDQETVFEDLGRPLLENAWQGYNCSVFAYGQTGSGKSYSILGRYPNEGFVPRLCKRLFSDIEEKEDTTSQVSFSMLEIYNETVRDLLSQNADNKLDVRGNTKTDSFFASGLKEVPVSTFEDIQTLLKTGNRKRATGATAMNDQSSRSHTIATIKLTQFNRDKNETILSEMKLVDLAGSENAKQSNTSGSRLREGQKINLSLYQLGLMIETLHKDSLAGKTTSTADFRSSKLTKLMKNAIGGNSKTVMIATISPAKDSYSFILSTLQYAQKANSIKNNAYVNQMNIEEQKEKVIEEKESGLRVLEKRKMTEENKEEIRILKAEIERLKVENLNIEEYWKSEISNAKERMKMMEPRYEAHEKILTTPHIVNINEDPMLSRRIYYFIENGNHLTIGNRKNKAVVNIPLSGISIKYHHATLRNAGDIVTLTPVDGKVWNHGQEIPKNQSTTLQHHDIILFGDNYNSGLFLFIDPKIGTQREHPSFDECVSVLSKGTQNDLTDEVYLKGLVNQMMGICNDANTMAEDLEKRVRFKVVLLPEICLGTDSEFFQTFIKAIDSRLMYFISKDDFRGLFAQMQCFYDATWNCSAESGCLSRLDTSFFYDPFDIPPSQPTRIGVVVLPLTSIPIAKNFTIYDFEKRDIGFMPITLTLCNKNGGKCNKKEYQVKKPLFFKIEIQKATVTVSNEFRTSWCEFTFPGTEEFYRTKEAVAPAYQYSFSRVIGNEKASPNLIETMQEKSLMIQFWIRYEEDDERPVSNDSNNKKPQNTEELKTKIEVLEKELDSSVKEISELRTQLDTKGKYIAELESRLDTRKS